MAFDPDMCVEVPAGFDDSDEDTQVYPVACKLFMGVTASEAFARAGHWVAAHDVRVTDVSWDNMLGEDEPHTLSLYFVFELDEEDEEDED